MINNHCYLINVISNVQGSLKLLLATVGPIIYKSQSSNKIHVQQNIKNINTLAQMCEQEASKHEATIQRRDNTGQPLITSGQR